MKVLLQYWNLTNGRQIISISKDQEQLNGTVSGVKASHGTEPDGDADEVEIPDEHGLAELVERETVFLHDDEMDAIIYPPS